MIKVDFHVHTSASDGLLSPTEIIQRAHKNNVKYLAITDHDTVSGLDIAFSESLKYDLTLIPGIELSTMHNNESVHILGFFKDETYKDSHFINEINNIKNHRIKRAKQIILKLKEEFNIEINFDKVLKESKDTIARPHIARAIIDAGYPYTFDEIFDNFIGNNCRAYVPTLKISTFDGINLLKRYGAIVFLAHPKLIKKTPLNDFLEMKLDGIEGIYFQNTTEETDYYLNIIENNSLLTSCGSDFHGNIESDPRHGDIGCMKIDDKYLIKFLNALDIKL